MDVSAAVKQGQFDASRRQSHQAGTDSCLGCTETLTRLAQSANRILNGRFTQDLICQMIKI